MQAIMREGRTGAYMYVVLEGRVAVSIKGGGQKPPVERRLLAKWRWLINHHAPPLQPPKTFEE
jgi:hypothetical protein